MWISVGSGVTPSQPEPILPEESLNIEDVLEKTRERLGDEHGILRVGSLDGYEEWFIEPRRRLRILEKSRSLRRKFMVSSLKVELGVGRE